MVDATQCALTQASLTLNRRLSERVGSRGRCHHREQIPSNETLEEHKKFAGLETKGNFAEKRAEVFKLVV